MAYNISIRKNKLEQKRVVEMVSKLRLAADQLVVALAQLQAGQNDGWVREYYRETITRLQEDLCIQLRKVPTGETLEQLNMFGTEND